MQTMDTPLREEIKEGINLKPLFKHMQIPLRNEIEQGVENYRLLCKRWARH